MAEICYGNIFFWPCFKFKALVWYFRQASNNCVALQIKSENLNNYNIIEDLTHYANKSFLTALIGIFVVLLQRCWLFPVPD